MNVRGRYVNGHVQTQAHYLYHVLLWSLVSVTAGAWFSNCCTKKTTGAGSEK